MLWTAPAIGIAMSPLGYERTFWGPVISVRFTPHSRHTEAQCPLAPRFRLLYLQEQTFLVVSPKVRS